MKKQFFYLLITLLTCSLSPLQAQDEIITHMGDRYVINVEALNPDSEMTLMDVLHMCPELISNNGTTITSGFGFRINNTSLSLDRETTLQNIKASELKKVQVCIYTSSAKGVDGARGVIDIYYKTPDKDVVGKVAVEGSTYGNGKLYADVNAKFNKGYITGYALTNNQYAKVWPSDGGKFTSRLMSEGAHLLVNLDLSSRDNLKMKFYQQFIDNKDRYTSPANTGTDVMPEIDRYWNFVSRYDHILNESGAMVTFEGGVDYLNSTIAGQRVRDTYPYYYTEFNIPVFKQAMWIMAGWEIDYNNHWNRNLNREQLMQNALYLQLDYSRGPWVITFGDRFKHLNFWNRWSNSADNGLFAHNRNENSYFASVGYKTGGHFVQAHFNRDYYVPAVEDFFDGTDAGRALYNRSIPTELVWRAEGRYTYQCNNLVFFGNVLHMWKNDLPTPNEQTTALRTAVTWNKGAFRLTAGVNYYHRHINASDVSGARYENYYNLKLAPTLLLGHGFRLSSVLLYNSKRSVVGTRPHLYASVKANKDFGRHINAYVNFHDIAGMPTMSLLQIYEADQIFSNRALTVGMTYRF